MSQRRDVVMLSGSYWPREGGQERQTKFVLEELSRRGWRCAVVTQALPDHPRHETINGVEVHRVGLLWAFRNVPRLGMVIAAGGAIEAAVRLRPRTIWSMMLGSQALAGAVASGLVGARHVVRIAGGGSEAHRSEAYARAASPLARVAITALLATRPVMTAPARHLLKDVEDTFDTEGVEMAVVPNGVVPAPPSSGRERVALWYARSGPDAGDELFRAVAERLPQERFKVMGRRVEDVPDNVENLGWVDHPEELMGRVGVLMNTQRTEGSPNAALQAISAGTPVVGFDNAGIVELAADHPRHVRAVPFDDTDAMASAVQAVLEEGGGLPPAAVPTPDEVATRWAAILEGTR